LQGSLEKCNNTGGIVYLPKVMIRARRNKKEVPEDMKN